MFATTLSTAIFIGILLLLAFSACILSLNVLCLSDDKNTIQRKLDRANCIVDEYRKRDRINQIMGTAINFDVNRVDKPKVERVR